ncbi:hypothetical protein RSC3_02092 [Bacillus paralicheniformis]|nr:hypothetical protein RSC3_02092 [Bacillus paralicheniformis]
MRDDVFAIIEYAVQKGVRVSMTRVLRRMLQEKRFNQQKKSAYPDGRSAWTAQPEKFMIIFEERTVPLT